MLSKAMEEAMNNQLKAEFQSAYQYLAMAAYCDSANLPGFAHWLRQQSKEEAAHAMKFYEYINDRGGRVVLQALEQPTAEFESALHVFAEVLEQEQGVTQKINQLYELAVQEKDYASQVFLNWFVEEQVEEEKSAQEIVAMLQMVGENPHALLMVDRQLAARE